MHQEDALKRFTLMAAVYTKKRCLSWYSLREEAAKILILPDPAPSLAQGRHVPDAEILAPKVSWVLPAFKDVAGLWDRRGFSDPPCLSRPLCSGRLAIQTPLNPLAEGGRALASQPKTKEMRTWHAKPKP